MYTQARQKLATIVTHTYMHPPPTVAPSEIIFCNPPHAWPGGRDLDTCVHHRPATARLQRRPGASRHTAIPAPPHPPEGRPPGRHANPPCPPAWHTQPSQAVHCRCCCNANASTMPTQLDHATGRAGRHGDEQSKHRAYTCSNAYCDFINSTNDAFRGHMYEVRVASLSPNGIFLCA